MGLLVKKYCMDIGQQYTVKSQFNEWPPSAPFHSLNRDFTVYCALNRWVVGACQNTPFQKILRSSGHIKFSFCKLQQEKNISETYGGQITLRLG